MVKRLFAICVLMVAVLVACGIPDNGQVSSIQEKDLRQLGDTIPPTTTSTTPATTIEPTTTTTALDTATTIATDDVTLYFISGGQLKGYPRPLAKPVTTNQVLQALQEGPPAGGLGVGIRSAVPSKEQALITSREDDSGIATIDLPPGFFEQTPPDDQLLAIGQIVLTVTEVGGIGQVLFVQSGQPLGVPRRSGGISNGTEPLARRDYVELVNQPTATTTTTTISPGTTVAATTV
ncbi:MAG TPA: GerMN domain-containing protein [Ilumatobacteraceae bacterium]|jgi:spore germination protein GerM